MGDRRIVDMDDDPPRTEATCADGRHRPDAVGFCQDCHVDCAPELRASLLQVYARAHSAERALQAARSPGTIGP